MKERKKLALLAGQPDENYQSLFIKGFLSQSFADNMDVCIFAMYEKYQDSINQEKGESCIFSVIDYSLFDAVVVLADTIQTPGLIDNIEKRLHDSCDKMVIFVDRESRYFKSINTDHYTPVKKLISHLIKDHGFTDIAYLTGKELHPHSKIRLQGFLDCMEENGLKVKENRIFYGDFWYSSGVGAAEKLLMDREHLPQAVACANDCMAIGLAREMVKAGIRIPEDMAVIGYDLSPEGRTSPKPVTSAPIPAEKMGVHIVKCIEAAFLGEDFPEFKSDVELFIGSSCGCSYVCRETSSKLRKTWDTESYQQSFYSVTDEMGDELLLQKDSYGFFNSVFSYINAVKPFHRFHLCLNTDWMDENKGKVSFTDKMIHVLKCSGQISGNSGVEMDAVYKKSEIFKNILDSEENPKAYYITPLFFEDRCYGFSAISYGNSLKCYDSTYRKWLGAVMRGLECFRRMKNLEMANTLLKAKQVRDPLTGFYNYNGLLENINSAFQNISRDGKYAEVIALELYGLNEMYQKNGIQGGNQVIVDFSQMVSAVIGNVMSCVLGNGEFIAIYLYNEEEESAFTQVDISIRKKLEDYNSKNGLTGKLTIIMGSKSMWIKNSHALEDLINGAISIKNGNKVKMQRHMQNKLTKEEQNESEVVTDIIDNNKLVYHFQPIVNAHTGEIFAYEALMRSDTPQFVSPLTILKYAEYSGRLYDVQKATFINVTSFIEDNLDKFQDRKIFINSIPGNHLTWEDEHLLRSKLEKLVGKIVVELTEQAEVDDDDLAEMKKDYRSAGVETAVDDYGTGYSNITNLLRYMPNYVKIDRMLLTDIHLSPQKQHFVKEIIEFAHDNQIIALAEGVETTEELQAVISLGADLIQGFYTAKPSRVVLQKIEESIQREIIQYSQLVLEKSGKKVYSAGQESTVSLVKLAAGNFSSIQIVKDEMVHTDIDIIGVPGFMPDMNIIIGDSYTGRIVLQDVELNKHKKNSGIFIGENCDVTLVLNGDNIIEKGGIIVPESSKLTIKGDGNICMRQIEVEGCGIGNTKNERHGDLYFEQDGAIEIYGNSMHGVGIGSGLGGNIYINRGKYVIDIYGQEAVGIGNLYGDMKQEIKKADIELTINNAIGLGIGSLEGSVDVTFINSSVKGYLGGMESVAVGSLRGKICRGLIRDSVIHFNVRANENTCGFGNLSGNADLEVNSGMVFITAESRQAIAMGSLYGKAGIRLINADVSTKVRSNLDNDMGADSLEIVNGRCRFMLNGKEVVREITEGEL